MLTFITTNPNVQPSLLQHPLPSITNKTFNQITLHAHTSTNDIVLLLPNPKPHHHSLTPHHPQSTSFYQPLPFTCEHLP
ncbi:bifunctional ornithine acetyltransferase/N-acetylglutamate synthase, partial [Priestia megaterium]|uniref:bifunctional ornithine acetyltransferase/N-acetylglutamate synthase n=1 Tax=Priestia megaterium TaxID=1404 RepID=UPI0039A016CF